MIRIAVVDDDQQEINKNADMISEFFSQKQIEYQISELYSGESLLECNEEYDIIFLDIQMNGLDGIETAQRFRTEHKQTALFYVTSYADYILKSMTLHPFAFIVKPVEKSIVYQNLQDYLDYISESRIEKENEYFRLQHENHWLTISVNEICYFHYMENRIIDVITASGKYQIKNNLSKLYETLNHRIFLMPQQSFIVNIRQIEKVDGKNKALIMKNGDVILIARRKYAEFFNLLNQYLSE